MSLIAKVFGVILILSAAACSKTTSRHEYYLYKQNDSDGLVAIFPSSNPLAAKHNCEISAELHTIAFEVPLFCTDKLIK